jgi:hypothetical protein
VQCPNVFANIFSSTCVDSSETGSCRALTRSLCWHTLFAEERRLLHAAEELLQQEGELLRRAQQGEVQGGEDPPLTETYIHCQLAELQAPRAKSLREQLTPHLGGETEQGYRRPHPLLPFRKRADQDEWESDDDDLVLPEEQELMQQIAEMHPRPQGYVRSVAIEAQEQGADQPSEPDSVALGLDAFEQRQEARQRETASSTFMLVQKVTENVAPHPSAQVQPHVPLSVQHLLTSVGISEEFLPDLSGRRHVSMPPSSGSRIKCASSTLQGKTMETLQHHNPRTKHPSHRKSHHRSSNNVILI